MKLFRDQKKMLNVLIATSVIMFISLFIGISKLIGITMSLWVINVFWLMYLSFFYSGVGLSDIVRTNERLIEEAKEKKNYTKVGVHSITLPMCAIGLLVVIGNIVLFFFI